MSVDFVREVGGYTKAIERGRGMLWRNAGGDCIRSRGLWANSPFLIG